MNVPDLARFVNAVEPELIIAPWMPVSKLNIVPQAPPPEPPSVAATLQLPAAPEVCPPVPATPVGPPPVPPRAAPPLPPRPAVPPAPPRPAVPTLPRDAGAAVVGRAHAAVGASERAERGKTTKIAVMARIKIVSKA